MPLRLAVHLGSLMYVFAAVAFAVAARARTCGTALGATIGIAATSYTINLVALLWTPLRFLRNLNPFGYYDTTAAARHIDWPDVGLLQRSRETI